MTARDLGACRAGGGSRGARRGYLATTLVALTLFWFSGCSRASADATPDGVVRLWLDKMESSTEDPRAMREAFVLLGPAARENLDERAQRASRVQGRRVEPYEMLAEGRFGLKFRPKAMVSRIDGDRAMVEVTGDAPLTEHAVVHCAREAAPSNAWRVEPDLPDVMALPRR